MCEKEKIETAEEKEKRRKEIIAEVICTLENHGVEKAYLMGMTEDVQHWYADAILGVMSEPFVAVVYDSSKIIEASMELHGWDYEEAIEWYGYNTLRSLQYIKKEDYPPVIVDPIMV